MWKDEYEGQIFITAPSGVELKNKPHARIKETDIKIFEKKTTIKNTGSTLNETLQNAR